MGFENPSLSTKFVTYSCFSDMFSSVQISYYLLMCICVCACVCACVCVCAGGRTRAHVHAVLCEYLCDRTVLGSHTDRIVY